MDFVHYQYWWWNSCRPSYLCESLNIHTGVLALTAPWVSQVKHMLNIYLDRVFRNDYDEEICHFRHNFRLQAQLNKIFWHVEIQQMKHSYFIEIETMWIFNKFECINDGIYHIYLLSIISFMCNRYYSFHCKYFLN